MNALTRTLRAYALRFPETREDFPWEDDRVIKVRKKIFVFLGDRSIGLKLTHSNQAALGLPFVEPMAYGLGRSGWVTVDLSKGRKPPVDLLEAWIDESYRAVAPRRLLDSVNAARGAPAAGHPPPPAGPASRVRKAGRPRSRPIPREGQRGA
jgi:predicted DNA-binding protein (MmcQ/YjbR family)